MRLGLGLDMTGRSAAGGGADPYAAYAENGFTPEVIADFAGATYRDNASNTTFADMFTFARASTATYFNSSGVLTTASSGVARTASHVWNGSSWVNRGLFLESQARTNLFLNSASPATQGVTVTAQPYTVSFRGTGSITFSGAHTGTLNGTGANDLVSATFTPSAGTVTCTVSGTISYPNFEAGSTPSSHIPTTGSTATRAAETLSIAAVKMAYSTAMSFAMEGLMTYADDNQTNTVILHGLEIDATSQCYTNVATGVFGGAVDGMIEFRHRVSSSTQRVLSGEIYDSGVNVAFNVASRHTASAFNGAVDGTALTAGTPAGMWNFGSNAYPLGPKFMGHISKFRQWAADIEEAGIEAASAPLA